MYSQLGSHVCHMSCRSARVDRREKEKELKKKDPSTPVTPTSGGGGGRRRSSSGVGGEGGDQYGLSLLFQPDNAPKGGVTPITEEAELKVKDTAVRTKFKVLQSPSNHTYALI